MSSIALVDVNNFYVSCEQMFNPKLRDKAVVVLSNNDGCAISRSDQAKLLGIKMGAPWFQIREQFNKGEVIVLSSNFGLYADMSNRVVNCLALFSPQREVYSTNHFLTCPVLAVSI